MMSGCLEDSTYTSKITSRRKSPQALELQDETSMDKNMEKTDNDIFFIYDCLVFIH